MMGANAMFTGAASVSDWNSVGILWLAVVGAVAWAVLLN
jgi:hypothetical protein